MAEAHLKKMGFCVSIARVLNDLMLPHMRSWISVPPEEQRIVSTLEGNVFPRKSSETAPGRALN